MGKFSSSKNQNFNLNQMASASESSRESSDTKGEDGEISDRIVDRRNTNFLENESYMFRSKEHCLMGIKGILVTLRI